MRLRYGSCQNFHRFTATDELRQGILLKVYCCSFGNRSINDTSTGNSHETPSYLVTRIHPRNKLKHKPCTWLCRFFWTSERQRSLEHRPWIGFSSSLTALLALTSARCGFISGVSELQVSFFPRRWPPLILKTTEGRRKCEFERAAFLLNEIRPFGS